MLDDPEDRVARRIRGLRALPRKERNVRRHTRHFLYCPLRLGEVVDAESGCARDKGVVGEGEVLGIGLNPVPSVVRCEDAP